MSRDQMSIQKPSAFATGEGPQVGHSSTSASSVGPQALTRGWSFPHGSVESPPTPISFAPAQALSGASEVTPMQPYLGVSTSASASAMSIPGSQHLAQNYISKRRISRHQSLPVPGDQFTSLVKRQEAARLRKISNGLSRSASGTCPSVMGGLHGVNVPGASTSSKKATAGHAQQLPSSSSMLSSAQSSSQMSSLMQASIMQSSMMLTQMMNQRIASNNAALRHNHMPSSHAGQQAVKAAAPGQMIQIPFHPMQTPTAPSATPAGEKPQQVCYTTMMPPRPAVNMSLHVAPPAFSAQKPDAHIPSTQAPSTQAHVQAGSPPLEPSARVAAELVVMLGAKMKEICEHQTVLVEQMQRMRQKIDDKDEIIRKLQEQERTDTAGHEKERVEMSDELARMKEQMRSMQSLIEAAARATMPHAAGHGVAKQLSELAMDSGDTEEDSSTTKGDDPDGEEPSTASTADGKAACRPSRVKHSGRYYFKPFTASSRRKRRELDELFRPKDSQHSTH